jgi:hypothetical protein
MVMGVRHPGYQLVSLYNPPDLQPGTPTAATKSCLLPDQLSIYVGLYLPLLALTFLIVALPRLYRYLTAPSGRRSSTPKVPQKAHSKTYSKGYNHARALSRQSLYSDSEPSSDDEAYGYNTSSANAFSYHTDEDGLPTPVTAASYFDRKSKSDRVRRVSRVYLWDGKKRDASSAGPASRLCQPVSRVIRKVWSPSIGRLFSSLGLDVLLWSTLASVWQIVWPGLALAVLVWVWFIL